MGPTIAVETFNGDRASGQGATVWAEIAFHGAALAAPGVITTEVQRVRGLGLARCL